MLGFFRAVNKDGDKASGHLTIGIDGIAYLGRFIPWSIVEKVEATESQLAIAWSDGSVSLNCSDEKTLFKAYRFASKMQQVARTSENDDPDLAKLLSETNVEGLDARPRSEGYRAALAPGQLVRVASHPSTELRDRVAAAALALKARDSPETRETLVRVAESLVEDDSRVALEAVLDGDFDWAEELRKRSTEA